MPPSSRFRLFMFGLLYFVQGWGLAYFSNFQKPYLGGLGIDPDVIGALSSILLVPFILKIFIGILSDRVSLFGLGHRKPYIILGLMLAALCFAAVGFVRPDRTFMLYAVLVVLASFSITLFDSTTDGYAIDVTPHEEHGIVQGVMTGGRALGLIVMSLVFGMVAQQQGGFTAIFVIMAVGMILPMLIVLRTREAPQMDPARAFRWSAFRELGRPRFLIFALYAVFYSLAAYGVNGLITYHMSQSFAAPDGLIGTYGALRGLGAVIGALGGGLFIDRIGRRPSAYGALIAITLLAALIGLAPGLNMVVALGILWGMAWGFQDTVFVALAMDLADARIAASMFAIMMALSNVGTAIGEGVATSLTDNIPFVAVFLLLAGINVLVIPIVWGLFRAAPEITTRAAAPAAAD